VVRYEGDERHAYDRAQQTVRMAQEHRQRRSERFALRLLQHALAGLGLLTQATVAYQRALELDRTLGYRHLAAETTADLARVALTLLWRLPKSLCTMTNPYCFRRWLRGSRGLSTSYHVRSLSHESGITPKEC
jgi:hypothetical protein